MPVPLRDSTANALRVLSSPSVHRHHNRGQVPLRRPSLLQQSAHLEPHADEKTFQQSSQQQQQQQQQQHLVLVGGGHAHAQVIKALNWASRPSDLKVTLIDQQSAASYSGMVPGCIYQRYTPDETLLHLQPLAEWAGIDFVHAKVVDIDLEQKLVRVATSPTTSGDANRHQTIPFDCISIDIGSTSRGLDDTPGAREFTIPTRPISKLVERIDRSIEEVIRDDEAQQPEAEADPRVVVIGGGAAGVELSMALNGRFRSQLPNKNTQVTLLDAGTELLPGESQRGREKLQQIMREQGIQVIHQSQVQELSENRIFASIDGKPTIIPYSHCVWATGAGAHPLAYRLQQKGLDATKHGWIRVNQHLQSTSHPFVFAAGDCCSIDNLPTPKAGVFAVRAGPVLIENLTAYLQQLRRRRANSGVMSPTDAEIEKVTLKKYVPQSDFLKLLVCGDGRALGLRFGQAFHGKWVMELKDKIDTNFMDLFRREHLTELKAGEEYDTSQYDSKMAAKTTLDPKEGAELLSRTDDDVDYQEAWSVIRTMADSEDYREQVLSFMGGTQTQEESEPTSAVAA
ncbi:NADH dehydrogenase [Seminavis robusta]|uniref:NADH dehydrogenase n=1 Tax=Seminavis robusta TaxID=568900 RepID=A0A9N8HBS4_9STRA|nr:NADH dehydrogenase [Seminavis robusta]|eukprot:Sro271_g104490.1 NADH dehydrogenase (569) ;mRNA; f:23361-25067